MMNDYLILLAVIQVLNMLAYWWVQRNFWGQSPGDIPAIFHDQMARNLLLGVPHVLGWVLVAFAFYLTDSPWLFLGLTIAGFVAFATPAR